MNEPPKIPKHCRNCKALLPENAKFCPQCSQKNSDGRITVRQLAGDFFTNLLSIDSKLFLTFWALFVPGKLTKEYFSGKHKSYANPVRLFLFAGITLFAVVISKTDDISFGEDAAYYSKRAERVRLRKSIRNSFEKFETVFPDTTEHYKTDSLHRWISSVFSKKKNSDSISINTDLITNNIHKISYQDFDRLSVDSLLVKYKFESGLQSLFAAQQIKTMKNGKGLFHFYIGKLPIAIFAMMPALAFILFMLYVRKSNYYFVEHLVFSFHTHTFAFITILALILICGYYLNGWIIALMILSIFVYQFLAMKKFYGQGFFKTFFKFSILNFLYVFVAIIFFVISVFISFLLF